MNCPVSFFFFILVFWVRQLREESNKVHNAELKLFLEVERGLDLRPIAPPGKTKEDILLFFKLYDPEKEQLCYVGRLFVKSTGNPMEYLAKLNKMAGYDPDEEIKLYELQDGDIVCFQKSHTVESAKQYRYPDVPSFLDYVHNRRQPKPQPIKYHGIDHLVDMLIHYNQTSDILYYEVLNIPLPELQCLKTSKVAVHHAIKDEVSILINFLSHS
ncbi:hypothetical protein Pint_31590 [Pistacia integerrima]|uniref:Uncharacterized protein n=1 Tax=Pistacia integerrima TaxID=434235 RepID=A0ACC0XQN2_9ROSI|nr:hypothetical protein Pint_31590 [Pistacia integerrima]